MNIDTTTNKLSMLSNWADKLGIPGATFTLIHDDWHSSIATHIDIGWMAPDKQRLLLRVLIEYKVIQSDVILGPPKIEVDEQATWDKIEQAALMLRQHAGVDPKTHSAYDKAVG